MKRIMHLCAQTWTSTRRRRRTTLKGFAETFLLNVYKEDLMKRKVDNYKNHNENFRALKSLTILKPSLCEQE